MNPSDKVSNEKKVAENFILNSVLGNHAQELMKYVVKENKGWKNSIADSNNWDFKYVWHNTDWDILYDHLANGKNKVMNKYPNIL